MDSLVENPQLQFPEEIIDSPEKAANALRDFFRPKNLPVLNDLKGDGIEFPGIIAATTSQSKQEGLQDLASKMRISMQPTLQEIIPEEEHKRNLKIADVAFWDYSNRMSWFKSFIPLRDNRPVLALDTVVLVNGKLMEKPRDEDELVSKLLKMQGRRVDIRNGIGVQIPREGRGPLFFYEEIDIMVPIRKFGETESRQYLSRNPDALNVAGGIDFSTEAGKSLIGNGKIKLQIPNGSIFNKSPNPSVLIFDKKALSALDQYFKGIPTDAVRTILGNMPLAKSSI